MELQIALFLIYEKLAFSHHIRFFVVEPLCALLANSCANYVVFCFKTLFHCQGRRCSFMHASAFFLLNSSGGEHIVTAPARIYALLYTPLG